jgi:uncharacterized integral membrane protein
MKFLRWMFLILLLVIFASFVTYNKDPVLVRLFFSFWQINVPMYLLLLGVAIIFFILGGLCVWIDVLRLKGQNKALKKQLTALEKTALDEKNK